MKNQEAFVYCWTDHKTNMLYVGYHKGSQNDGYICSSKWVLEEYKKRPEDFTRMILAEGTAEDCHALEITILKSADAMHSKRFYNQTNSGVGFLNKHATQEHRNKISAKLKGKSKSEEHVKKISLTSKGRRWSEESKNNNSVSKKIYYENHPELREHLSKIRKGRVSNRKGVKCLQATKDKCSASQKKRFASDPTNHPLYGRIPWNKGISYEKKTCPYCGVTGGGSNMSRWHFDNCKHVRAEPLE